MAELKLKNILENSIKAEDNGFKFYNIISEKFADNPELKEIFEKLAKDEAEHKKQFEELLLNYNETINFHIDETDFLFLESIDISRYFEDFFDSEKTLTASEIIKNAWEFEKDSVIYYSTVRSMISKSNFLDEIIKIEKMHTVRLFKVLVTESKFRGLSDTW